MVCCLLSSVSKASPKNILINRCLKSECGPIRALFYVHVSYSSSIIVASSWPIALLSVTRVGHLELEIPIVSYEVISFETEDSTRLYWLLVKINRQ